MRKSIAILLIPVFLLMTAGVAITSLYCKGKISEVCINIKACCKDVNKGGCCDTTTKVVKVESDFVSHPAAIEFYKLVVLDIPKFNFSYISRLINVSYSKSYWDKAPPLGIDYLYIVYRSLII